MLRHLARYEVRLLACAVYTTQFDIIDDEKILRRTELLNGLNQATEFQLCIEDLHFVCKNNIDWLHRLRPFACTLTWNNQNALGGGAHTQNGLTDWGKSVVRYLKKHKIFVDTAHLSRQSFYDVARIWDGRMLCSHTCCDGLNKHNRNLTDEQLKIITQSKGFVGITLVSHFLSEKQADSRTVARHIDYFVQKFGVDCVGIGSDFFGTKDLPTDVKCYADFKNIRNQLQKLGYDNISLDKIFYLNYFNFTKSNKI